MSYFIGVRTNAPKNKKERALQEAIKKYGNTTTDLFFDELVKGFQQLVDSANATYRSKEAKLRADSYEENGHLSISDDNIVIYLTKIKGYVRHDFAIQTQI